jgi:hypothetical protein
LKAEEVKETMTRRFYYEVDETEVLWMQSARVDNAVVLWERAGAHPNGETLIGGVSPTRAALTQKVVDRINAGEIRVLGEEEAKQADKRRAEQAARAKAQALANIKESKRQLYIQAVGTDRGFEQLYAAAPHAPSRLDDFSVVA